MPFSVCWLYTDGARLMVGKTNSTLAWFKAVIPTTVVSTLHYHTISEQGGSQVSPKNVFIEAVIKNVIKH